MNSSIEALKSSGSQILARIPKSNAMGSSIGTLKTSGSQIFEKLSKTSNPVKENKAIKDDFHI